MKTEASYQLIKKAEEKLMNDQKPRLEKQGNTWEVNPSNSTALRVIVPADFNVEIDKLHGPLAAHTLRLRLEHASAEWVVERQEIDGSAWIEVARWDCQLGYLPNR